jgi:hypothetical protein
MNATSPCFSKFLRVVKFYKLFCMRKVEKNRKVKKEIKN